MGEPTRRGDVCPVCFAVMADREGHIRFHKELLQTVSDLNNSINRLHARMV